jgi:hypothetical protein
MNGYAIAHLPERFQQQPKSKAVSEYINLKYSKYGYRKGSTILYNPEWHEENARVSGYRYKSAKLRWVENVTDGLRKAGDAHEIAKLDHTGWYTNEFCDELVHGEVYQLPTRNGEEQYIPAVSDSNNDNCACLDFSSITSDKKDAARWADSMAEQWAEREREYQAEESAKQRLRDIADEIKDEYQEFRRVSRELRANCDAIKGVSIVRELVRERWQHTKAVIRKLKREQRAIEANGYRLEDGDID